MRARGIPIAILVASSAAAFLAWALGFALAGVALVPLLGTVLLLYRPQDEPGRRSAVARLRAAPVLPREAPLDSVAEHVAGSLALHARALRADRVLLLSPSSDRRSLRVAATGPANGPARSHLTFPRDAGLPGAVLGSGEPLAATLGDQTLRLCPYYAEDRGEVAQALAAPLRTRDGEHVLVAERRDDEAFGKQEAVTISAAARTLGWALEMALALRDAEERAAQLAQMAEAADGLVRADPDAVAEVARSAVAAARRLVPVDAAVVTRHDPEKGTSTIVHVEGVDLSPGTTFPDDAGMAGKAGRHRTILPAGGRYARDAGPVLAPDVPFPPFREGALAIVPLVAGDVLAGNLVLAARNTDRYERDHVRLLLRSVANVTGAQLARRTVEASLAELARTDALTGTANRRAFDEALPAALGRSVRYGHPTSLLLLDLDHFKAVNDSRGHAMGDVVLGALGQLLRGLARDVDVPARLGGDEFALILEHTDAAGARRVAERVRQTLAHTPFPGDAGAFRVTTSVGIATYPPHGADGDGVFAAADAAVYRAKREGGNRVCCAPEPPAAR